MGGTTEQVAQIKQTLSDDSGWLGKYRDLAKAHNIWLSLGGFQEKIEGMDKRHNTHIIIDSQGKIVSSSRKIHLFDVQLSKEVRCPGLWYRGV
jgi:predicted amidohydrolase